MKCNLTSFHLNSQCVEQAPQSGDRPGAVPERAAEAVGTWAQPGRQPSGTCAARVALLTSLTSALPRPHSSVQPINRGTKLGPELCFSKVKCVGGTLNLALHPISYGYSALTSIRPVKALALYRENYGSRQMARKTSAAQKLSCLRMGSSNFYFQDYFFLLYSE